MFAASLAALAPAALLIKGVPLDAWPGAYIKFLIFIIPMGFAACVMALLYGRLVHSSISLPVCTLLFGVAMPLVFIGSLSLSVLLWHGSFLKGLDTPQGQKNVLFLFLLFGFLGSAIYWALEREARKR